MKKNTHKYIQVENYILNKIKNGTLQVGDKVETEEELTDFFGFSRMTINKALNRLVDQGYLYRIAGSGTFVRTTHISKLLKPQIESFTEDMESVGLKPGSKLLSYELIKSDDYPEIKEKLDIEDNIFLHYFVRLRFGDDIPIAISHNYVSTKVLPSLDISALEGSFYKYITENNYEILKSDVDLEATLPTENQKKLLKIENEALLNSNTLLYVRYNKQEYKLGYFETYYVGSMYTYRLR